MLARMKNTGYYIGLLRAPHPSSFEAIDRMILGHVATPQIPLFTIL